MKLAALAVIAQGKTGYEGAVLKAHERLGDLAAMSGFLKLDPAAHPSSPTTP